MMPLTHDFKETVRVRAQRDPAFRQELLREAVECIINGDLETGKAVLRDYVNATVGFQALESRTRIPAKSLMVCSARKAARRQQTSPASLLLCRNQKASNSSFR
jgi:hypothetical protein